MYLFLGVSGLLDTSLMHL